MPIDPSQARYRMARAFQRLSNALGVQLLPTDEDCVCLERLATQAERWRRLDECAELPTTEQLEEDLTERIIEELADDRAREDWENHAE